MKKIINTPNGPAPIGPYSQAVQIDKLTFVSGQIAIDPQSGDMITGDLEAETHQVMKNIGAILEAAGLGFANVLKTSIFLKNMEHFSIVNNIYGSYFEADFPARETVEVSRLPKSVNVEISVIASK